MRTYRNYNENYELGYERGYKDGLREISSLTESFAFTDKTTTEDYMNYLNKRYEQYAKTLKNKIKKVLESVEVGKFDYKIDFRGLQIYIDIESTMIDTDYIKNQLDFYVREIYWDFAQRGSIVGYISDQKETEISREVFSHFKGYLESNTSFPPNHFSNNPSLPSFA